MEFTHLTIFQDIQYNTIDFTQKIFRTASITLFCIFMMDSHVDHLIICYFSVFDKYPSLCPLPILKHGTSLYIPDIKPLSYTGFKYFLPFPPVLIVYSAV